jgi:prolyl-tRNA synthetase
MHTYTNAFVVTVKESPNDAELVSHQLMIRAGLIKKMAAGVYTILPMGHRVFQKMIQIIRDEMNAIGSAECTLPVTIPADLWKKSGRWDKYGRELLRFVDRHDRPFCLGPTHEEVITDVVSAYVTSYKQLPMTLYQIHTKFRDEIRPRFGVMRSREFIMKDAYSFHDSAESLDATYAAMQQAYHRIFERCGLTVVAAQADSGAIGGNESVEFLVVAACGEDSVLVNTEAGFVANSEACPTLDPGIVHHVSVPPYAMIHTPNCPRITDICAYRGIQPNVCLKSILIMVNDAPIMLCLPGDRDINEAKIQRLVGAFRWATSAELTHYLGCSPGYVGPLNTEIPVWLDYGLKTQPHYTCGANQDDHHVVNVSPDRDIPHGQWADLKMAIAGDPCPSDPSVTVSALRGIEVGHVFKLGTTYSQAMDATFTNATGTRMPFIMGCYGIGVGRTVAACIEQCHDDNGLCWPAALAPFHVVILNLCPKNTDLDPIIQRLVAAIESWGYDVIVDNRPDSPGVKFNDADLLGFPYQIIVGRKTLDSGHIERKCRKTGETIGVSVTQMDVLKSSLN